MLNYRVFFYLIVVLFISQAVSAQEAEKPIVAILDFSGEGISESESIAITNLLMTTVYDTGLVDVIDRNQREEILAEISFSLSGCVDDKCAVEVGKMLAADAMITGSVNKIGSRYAVDVKVLDVATTTIAATFYKLYESIDEIVDNIDGIGGQIVQNFTGKIAQKKEVFEYEDLVPLIVLCDVEGAAVFIDGKSIGTISDGKISKAVNKGAEVSIAIKMAGFWDYEENVLCEDEIVVTAVMDERKRHRFALSAVFGGGMMGSVFLTLFPVRDWAFISLGAGFNLIEIEPLLLKIPIVLKLGSFIIYNDKQPFRLYAGMGAIINSLTKYADNEIKALPGFSLNDSAIITVFSGVEYKFNDHFRSFVELDLGLNRPGSSPSQFYEVFQLALGVSFY